MEPNVSRRELMTALAAGAACLACGPLLQGCAALAGGPVLRGNTGGDGFVRLDIAELEGAELAGANSAASQVAYVDYETPSVNQPAVSQPPGAESGRLVLFAQPDGSWRAFSRRCTHAGGTVRWSPGQGRLRCPRHGSEFGSDGRVLTGPAVSPLSEYPTHRDGAVLVIRIV